MTAWLSEHAMAFGLWGMLAMVLLVPALEAALPLIGVILPGQTAVVVGGIFAYHHRAPLPGILAAALIGGIAGNVAGYYAGQRWNSRLLAWVPQRMLKPRQTDRAMRLVERNSAKAVFVGRFTVGLRTFVPTMCGISGIPIRRFMLWSVLSSAIWAPTFVAVGFAAAPGIPL
jgi:membrane-associated protein